MSPTFYGPRKTNRASWTQENLDKALKALQNKNVSIREVALKNNIPEKTLRTRIKENNFIKGKLGKKSHLGEEVEKKLVEHVIQLQSVGFAPSRKNLRKLAYNLSQKLGLKQVFNIEKKIAGKDWYRSFMRRNPTLSIRKPRGTSNARANAMNKEDIKNYFDLLKQCLSNNNLMNKPSNIYNMDESGLQLNNEPDVVVALKGSKNVQVRQCTERGETITVVTCCNAEGSFLPPYCIFKGVRKQEVWDMNMPPGSVIQMRKESAYINENLFLDWLENHFIPRKSPGKCLLILDGHGSHINSPDMLQMAVDNDIQILCLPSHTTHYLQPLDRAFFKPLKTYFRDAACEWGNANPTKKIGRIHFGLLLSKAWSQAATIQTGISGFRATGIYPFCPSAIPEHAYLQNAVQYEESSESEEISLPITTNSSSTQTCIMTDENRVEYYPTLDESQAQPGPSNMDQQPVLSAETPTKPYQVPVRRILKQISPIPKTDNVTPSLRKQKATLVTTPEIISTKRKKRESKEPSAISEVIDLCKENACECIECYESYNTTLSKVDWIQCIKCNKWLHETCTLYHDTCNLCKREELKKAKEEKKVRDAKSKEKKKVKNKKGTKNVKKEI